MCGIAGVFEFAPPFRGPLDQQAGLRMVGSLIHRGPDDGGLLVAPKILLGHRRLAIIDLSDEGHQPMATSDQQLWLVYNGEIYNHQELRAELQTHRYHFRSQSDTEVLLQAYAMWGDQCLARLNGMFAFAIWDRRRERLFLARDGLGIKPLFFAVQANRFYFGSEIKAILAHGDIPRRPDWIGLDHFLTLGYTPAPATGFAEIQALPPGHSLSVDDRGVSITKWFDLPYPDNKPSMSLLDATEHLTSALDQAVARQMISDVPIGAFLSGGLDSSAIVRSMTRRTRPETFTIGFEQSDFDESQYAESVAKTLNTHHHCERMAAQASELLTTLVAHAEEPLADNSMMPLYLLSQSVRRHVTVALSGDGADELLAGYETYRADRWAASFRRMPMWLRQAIVPRVVSNLPASSKKYGFANVLNRFLAAAHLDPPRDHCSWRRYVQPDLREALYTKQWLAKRGPDAIDLYAQTLKDAPDWLSPLEQQLHVDIKFHLPYDMLVKVDRMSMAHALEVRVPFLDFEVLKTCLAIPTEFKHHGKWGKRVLRQSLMQDLPHEIIYRKKAGFLIPLESWMARDWQPLLRQWLTREFCEATGMLQADVVETMISDQATGKRDYAYPLFAMLILSIWWKTWIAGECSIDIKTAQNAKPTRIHQLANQI